MGQKDDRTSLYPLREFAKQSGGDHRRGQRDWRGSGDGVSPAGEPGTFSGYRYDGGSALAQARGACFHPVDVRNIAALREAINNIAAREGRIDVLINNAARDDRTDTFTVEPEARARARAVNLITNSLPAVPLPR